MSHLPLKLLPTFTSEKDERNFWAEADSTEYLDWSSAESLSFPEPRSIFDQRRGMSVGHPYRPIFAQQSASALDSLQ